MKKLRLLPDIAPALLVATAMVPPYTYGNRINVDNQAGREHDYPDHQMLYGTVSFAIGKGKYNRKMPKKSLPDIARSNRTPTHIFTDVIDNDRF
jgi:hypothetical protein